MALNNAETNWNQFIIRNNGSFLQSWQWAEFQRAAGCQIWRIEINNELKGLVVKRNLPFGKNYLYCPRGPVGDFSKIKEFLAEVEKIAESEKSIFFKIEPESDIIQNKFLLPERPSQIFAKQKLRRGVEGLKSKFYPSTGSGNKILNSGNKILGVSRQVLNDRFIKSSKQIQPSKTIILDITKSEQELLQAMRPKARYNIGLAEKKGVKITRNNRQIDKFLELLKKTGQRDNFHLHQDNYYRKMTGVLGGEGMLELFLAECEGRVVAANLVCFFGQTATYLHGASDYNFRNLMAPYLLQWQAILEAKRRGCQFYDFWGIDEKKWPGVTRFKRGFGGKEMTYPGAFDLIFKPVWHRIYGAARKVL